MLGVLLEIWMLTGRRRECYEEVMLNVLCCGKTILGTCRCYSRWACA